MLNRTSCLDTISLLVNGLRLRLLKFVILKRHSKCCVYRFVLKSGDVWNLWLIKIDSCTEMLYVCKGLWTLIEFVFIDEESQLFISKSWYLCSVSVWTEKWIFQYMTCILALKRTAKWYTIQYRNIYTSKTEEVYWAHVSKGKNTNWSYI